MAKQPKRLEKKIEIVEGKNFHKELKIEKIEKIEHKELKHEKLEKNELKENKNEKIEHKEFKEFKEFKEHGEKPIKEKDGKELVENPGDIFDPVLQIEALKAHLEQLEKAAVEVRHFIESAERPDLGEGALKNEKDKSG
ncbi:MULTISPECIES: hypothetical protein [unclassified Sphingopyxis]|jgi:hypothetical protein|uniref:hypothetical protein n=1 Tax=unclassified Sphingopyxis TaxID=2614943 RepID=UPI000730E265|nr:MULTISPECIES: hypothetical protein [unclassified Sphingopyxis]MBD3731275.1 hypothetical protein [Sphingopyxis sp.]KTE26310.1 hypothetical protein ATE61_06040 [Sphingopyxis sp. H057]KTE52713.1 hypothetical protein ATE64_08485 [Sphingopyxis sp. H073]KTE54903.1 hypothetical protein ATE69_08465 [Sphingopyxis sp. H071]KTE62363.1 hypothetical protein ATE66_02400 [Sphingopyxis sp. H107]